MLAVALDLEIDAGQVTALDWQRETLLEILTRLFSEKLVDAVRQGMPRRLVESCFHFSGSECLIPSCAEPDSGRGFPRA